MNGQREHVLVPSASRRALRLFSSKISFNMSGRKRPGLCSTLDQKHMICEYAKENSSASQQEIANHFSLLWKFELKCRTVGEIVADAAKWMSATDDISSCAKMLRHARHEHMEKALYLWFSGVRAKNLPVTEDILLRKWPFVCY